ncbi:MAG: hypothetical protein L0228_14905 [Planctomycetes bacterium]|nr:hypothetical protein [Planctomycetota bacterium]
MNIRRSSTEIYSRNGMRRRAMAGGISWNRSDGDVAAALAAARARLATSTQEYRRRHGLFNQVYYGDRSRLEEALHEFSCDAADAVVTRNHYGSVVLNAAHTLFIDVDMHQTRPMSRLLNASSGHWQRPWRRMLRDLRTVLSSENEEGFRIYRTAAGFRILGTTHEFDAASARSKRLMTAVGADDAFVRLCEVQKTFRARLTPKPWRCGTPLPPNSYPRRSKLEKQRFTEWLSRYEDVCRNRATCQFLEHVGRQETHARVAPIIQLHDRETKAFEALELA